jgi:hypothetical protein
MITKKLTPKPYEHILAYLTRTCMENNINSLSKLFVESGIYEDVNSIDLVELISRTEVLNKLAGCIGVSRSLLIDLRIQFMDGFHYVLGEKIPEGSISIDSIKCCPACIKEQGHIASYYALKPMGMCLKHQSPLVKYWHDGSVITWSDENIYERICDKETISIDLTDSEEALSRCVGRLLMHQSHHELPNIFGTVDISNFLLILDFAYRNSFDVQHSSQTLLIKNELTDWAVSYEKILHTPSLVYDFIENFKEHEIKLNFRNFVAIYPDLYKELYRGMYSSTHAYLMIQILLEKSILRTMTQ